MRFTTVLRSPHVAHSIVGVALLSVFVLRAGKGIEGTWIMAGTAALVAILYARSRKIDPWAFWAGALFLLWSVFSFFFSSIQTYGLDELLRDAAGFLLFCAAARSNENDQRRFAFMLTVLAVLACIVGSFVYVLQPVSRFVGVFFHVLDVRDYWPNAWAEFVLLSWPLAFGTLLRRRAWLRNVVLGILFASLALSFSRGAAMVFVVQVLAAAAVAVIALKKRQVHPLVLAKELMIITGITLILFAGLTMLRAQTFPVESVTAKVTLTSSEGTQTADERLQFWAQSFALSKEKPLFGWGPGSFRFVQPRLQKDVLATSDHPHNIILKFAMERGWVGAAFFAFFLTFVFIRLMSGPWTVDRTLIGLSLAGVLLHTLIDYNLQFALIAMPLWMLLGFASSSASHQAWFAHIAPLLRFRRTPSNRSLVQQSVQMFISIAILLTLVLETRFMVWERLGTIALKTDPHTGIEYLSRAQHMLYPRDLHLNLADALLSQRRLEEAITVLQELRHKSPEDARLWILLGDVSMMMHKLDDAHAAYSQAMRLSGFNDLRPLHGVLQTLARSSNAAERTAFRNLAHETLLIYAEAIRDNKHFIALSWQVDEFVRTAQEYARVYPLERAAVLRMANEIQLVGNRERAARKRAPKGILW